MRYQFVSIYGHTLAVSAGVSMREIMALFPHFEKKFGRREVMQKWIPFASAAARLGVSVRQVQRLAKSGALKLVVLSDADLWPNDKKTWILARSLERYIEKHAMNVRVSSVGRRGRKPAEPSGKRPDSVAPLTNMVTP